MSSSGRTGGDGPVALVTGAGGGIGAAVVTAFARAGRDAPAVDRDVAGTVPSVDGGWTAR